jgi:dolichol kinase/phosphoserine phosphatase
VNILLKRNHKNPKLIVFDVEGVLVPKNRLFFELARALGTLPLIKVLFYGFLYEIGATPLKEAIRKIFKILRGTPTDLLTEKFDQIPLIPGARKVFNDLKEKGYKTALISSGLPTFLVEKIGTCLEVDYSVGLEVGIKDQTLSGEVWGDVIEPNGKFLVLKELMEAEHIALDECVVIADDRNNSSIFLEKAKKIGYEPDFLIRLKADTVINGKLEKIVPIVNGEEKKKRWPTKKSILREFIHGSGISIPILALLFGVFPVALFTVCVVIFYSLSEVQRVRGKTIPFFSTVTRHAASISELRKIAFAPIYFAIGILLTILIFPSPASSAAIAIFALGDSTASLIGGTMSGKHLPYNGAKTLEGSAAFLFFSFVGALLFVSPLLALIGALVGTVVEYLPLPINDNLLIPTITALALTLLI